MLDKGEGVSLDTEINRNGPRRKPLEPDRKHMGAVRVRLRLGRVREHYRRASVLLS
ncbi:hypothetical protein [Sphingobacterium sp. BIGb0165]|uniref:hypothetical protein n=1 Tax=Sphingobacterium sp. BIGb0165 TaxID=2940615 RepID=UPI002167601B|nr:hypothetical protein [Sphingobacterium sp. BIGb0165]MCS4228423.1 hypothetical protein [Sphingobacterium sp. BIGb0165]